MKTKRKIIATLLIFTLLLSAVYVPTIPAKKAEAASTYYMATYKKCSIICTKSKVTIKGKFCKSANKYTAYNMMKFTTINTTFKIASGAKMGNVNVSTDTPKTTYKKYVGNKRVVVGSDTVYIKITNGKIKMIAMMNGGSL